MYVWCSANFARTFITTMLPVPVSKGHNIIHVRRRTLTQYSCYSDIEWNHSRSAIHRLTVFPFFSAKIVLAVFPLLGVFFTAFQLLTRSNRSGFIRSSRFEWISRCAFMCHSHSFSLVASLFMSFAVIVVKNRMICRFVQTRFADFGRLVRIIGR